MRINGWKRVFTHKQTGFTWPFEDGDILLNIEY